MPRILVYDNTKAVDSRGRGINQILTADSANPARAKPVRLFGGKEPGPRFISYEFLYNVADGVSSLDIRCYREFWNDDPVSSLALPPSDRNWPEVNVAAPWSREVCSEVTAGTGTITHRIATRTLTMAGAVLGTSWYLHGFQTYALWERLVVWINGTIPTGARLQIYAHVGDHHEEEYLKSSGNVPYDYNA